MAGDWFPFGHDSSTYNRRRNSSITKKLMVSNTEKKEGDVWFPFGDRNDPKLRRSFNRGVRYAGFPRTSIPLNTTPTTNTTDVSIINPELPGNSIGNSNSENEQPKTKIITNVESRQTTAALIQATDMEIVNNKKSPNKAVDFEVAAATHISSNNIIMNENDDRYSPKPRQVANLQRSISTTSANSFDTFYSPNTPTSKCKNACFCCHSQSSICCVNTATTTPQNGFENENYMSMSQQNHSQQFSHCSNPNSNNISNFYSPQTPTFFPQQQQQQQYQYYTPPPPIAPPQSQFQQQQPWHFPSQANYQPYWPPPQTISFPLPSTSPSSNNSFVASSSNSPTTNNPPSTNPTQQSPLLVYQLVPIDMVSGLPAIIPQVGSPQFIYATSVNGQPVPISIHQSERDQLLHQQQSQRRDSKISLPPIFNFSQPFTNPASPTTSSETTTSSLSWNSDQDNHNNKLEMGITAEGINEHYWKLQEDINNLQLSQPPPKIPKPQYPNPPKSVVLLEPIKPKEKEIVLKQNQQKINDENEKEEGIQQILRTPSPIDKRPIRPSPGGRYQIPDDLPCEDLYHAIPLKKEKETATIKQQKEKEKEKNNNDDTSSPKKQHQQQQQQQRSPSDLGLFSSVEIRSPFRRRSDMLPPRPPPARNASMTKLASNLSPKALTPPADLRRSTKPIINLSASKTDLTDDDSQNSPRTFFTRSKQYRSFNVKTTNVTVNPAVEHLKMLKQKLLDHQQVIKNRGGGLFDQHQQSQQRREI